ASKRSSDRDELATMGVVSLLLVASVVAQIYGSSDSCKELGGSCHANGCPRSFSNTLNGSCPDNGVCCITKGPQPMEALPQLLFDSSERAKKKCRTKSKCKKNGGTCAKKCAGKVIKGKRMCKGRKCVCCKEETVPPVTAPPSDCSCGVANTGSRIIGGSEINPPQKYPWLVALQEPGYWTGCGGSIINDRYILTAAHCLYTFKNTGKCYYDPPKELNILVGDHHQFSTSDNNAYTAKITMKKNIIHPTYNCKTQQNDFALIELSEAIELNDVIKPVCLPTDDSKTFESAMGTVAGWGTKDDDDLSKIPLEVDLPILDTNCGGYETITSNMLCAGYPETGGKDSCQGDSGGPFVVNENGKYVQVGVVSFGKGCALKNHPGVYARVSKVLDWIKSISASGKSCNN
ncbi:unnamed protein product, partial [Meganyctiphanes norvegica]